MTQIMENQELEFDNLLSFRGKVGNEQLQQINVQMEQLIKESGAEKKGYPITVTYGVEGNLMDIEILVPLDKKIDSKDTKFVFKDKLKILHALKAVHTGNPAGLQNTCNELNEYMTKNQMVPVTAGYNITRKVDMLDINNSEIDIYVGINPNIL